MSKIRFAASAHIVPGNLSTFSLCHLYRLLQFVLRYSQWQSILIDSPSFRGFQSLRHPSSINEWISKPFPGFWTCKKGFLLWRSPFPSDAARTNVRIFCLSSIDDIVLGKLIRVYWHALCRPSILPRQCQASSLPKARPRRTECRNCHDTVLRFSKLKRNHQTLLKLLIDRPGVKENLNLNRVLQNLETLMSTGLPCWKSKVERIAIFGGSYVQKNVQRSENVGQERTDKLYQRSKKALGIAKHTHPSASCGVASDAPNFWFPRVMVTTIKTMVLEGLRVVRLCEPPLQRGKTRVRWRCVSNPQYCTLDGLCPDLVQQCCGRFLFDDFIERRPGAARDLEELLNKSAPAGSGPDQGQTIFPANISSTAINTKGPQSWNPNISPEALAGSYEPRPRRRAEGSISIDCDPERHWLLICARSKERPTSLTQLDLCCTSSDKELFQELRRTYMSLKSKWARLFSFKMVQSIRFVQVSKPIA